MQNILTVIRKHSTVYLTLAFIVINLLFNYKFLPEILQNSPYRTFGGDGINYQYFAEMFYKNILNLKNPFEYNDRILYPFGSSTVFQDLGFIHSLYFIFLRPFFSLHSAILISLILSILLSQIFTYLLLRNVGISKTISFIFSLVYSFNPGMVIRLQGHFSYIHFFIFPLFLLLSLKVFKKDRLYLMHAFLLGATISLFFYTTAYFFIILLISVFLFSILSLFFFSKNIKNNVYKIKKIALPVFLVITGFLITISPVLLSLTDSRNLKELSRKNIGWGGADFYSAKILSPIIPSPYNFFYGKLLKDIPENKNPEGIMYPGILILIGLFGVIILKKIPKLYKIFFLICFIFYLLSLGPFIYLPNLYKFYLPDPIFFWKISFETFKMNGLFQILHPIPFFSDFRSPLRFVFPFTFFGSLVAAYFFEQITKNSPKKYYLYFLIFTIFIFDQFYKIEGKGFNLSLPIESYKYIKSDSGSPTVLELPFTLRDGHMYLGDVTSNYFQIGQLIHQKQVLGTNIGRINSEKFDFYKSNNSLNYLMSLTDKQRGYPKSKIPSPQDMSADLNSLNIKFIIVNKKLIHSNEIKNALELSNFKPVFLDDNNFTLYEKYF